MNFYLKVLYVTSVYDLEDSVYWTVDPEKETVKFWVLCNDFFYWGAADAEDITPDNLPLLEATAIELEALPPDETQNSLPSSWIAELFCARSRKMRPQGAFYKHIPRQLWQLFDDCGPEREVGLGNPVAHPLTVREDHTEN